MEKNTFTDTTLKRIRSGEQSNNTKKKRKTSRIFLIIDGILIIILLTFIFNKKPEQIYKSTTLNYKDLNIRFSINTDKESGDYLIFIAFKSNSERKKVINFKKSIANVSINYNNQPIIKKLFGRGSGSMILEPGQVKTEVETIDNDVLKKFAAENPDYIKAKRKFLFQFDKPHIPITANIIVNMEEKLYTTINFDYEVE